MSAQKVRRFDMRAVGGYSEHAAFIEFDENDTGRYIEYADVAGLVEALMALYESYVKVCPRSNLVAQQAFYELARWQS